MRVNSTEMHLESFKNPAPLIIPAGMVTVSYFGAACAHLIPTGRVAVDHASIYATRQSKLTAYDRRPHGRERRTTKKFLGRVAERRQP